MTPRPRRLEVAFNSAYLKSQLGRLILFAPAAPAAGLLVPAKSSGIVQRPSNPATTAVATEQVETHEPMNRLCRLVINPGKAGIGEKEKKGNLREGGESSRENSAFT
jgi:hypothetical protein